MSGSAPPACWAMSRSTWEGGRTNQIEGGGASFFQSGHISPIISALSIFHDTEINIYLFVSLLFRVFCYTQLNLPDSPTWELEGFFCFCFFGGTGVQTQGLVLSKCSITWAKPLSLFAFNCFSDRVSYFCLDCDPPISASCVAWMRVSKLLI
jgi:hypothetical protein